MERELESGLESWPLDVLHWIDTVDLELIELGDSEPPIEMGGGDPSGDQEPRRPWPKAPLTGAVALAIPVA